MSNLIDYRARAQLLADASQDLFLDLVENRSINCWPRAELLIKELVFHALRLASAEPDPAFNCASFNRVAAIVTKLDDLLFAAYFEEETRLNALTEITILATDLWAEVYIWFYEPIAIELALDRHSEREQALRTEFCEPDHRDENQQMSAKTAESERKSSNPQDSIEIESIRELEGKLKVVGTEAMRLLNAMLKFDKTGEKFSYDDLYNADELAFRKRNSLNGDHKRPSDASMKSRLTDLRKLLSHHELSSHYAFAAGNNSWSWYKRPVEKKIREATSSHPASHPT